MVTRDLRKKHCIVPPYPVKCPYDEVYYELSSEGKYECANQEEAILRDEKEVGNPKGSTSSLSQRTPKRETHDFLSLMIFPYLKLML